jgi:hypothetical protein
MKKLTKKFAAFALALVTALTAVPLTAQAAVSAPAKTTTYRTSKSTNYPELVQFTVSGLSKSDEVKKVKSSKASVATPYLIEYHSSSWSVEDDQTGGKDSGSNYNALIQSWIQKAGTTNISYTIGKKKYTTKVTIKNYTNPLESLKITGVQNGTNLANLADKSTDPSPLSLSNDQEDATISISAKSGWTITYAALEGSTTYSVSPLNKGLSSATLRVGTLEKDSYYFVSVNLENTKDGGTLSIVYPIYPNADK